jgi:hypothetical protein
MLMEPCMRIPRSLSKLLTVCLLLALPAASGAMEPDLPFEVEAEDYVAYNDLGGVLIDDVGCPGTSSGYIVKGLDRFGEWIELSVTFPESGYYKIEVGIQGSEGLEYELRTTLVGGGPVGEDLRAEYFYVGEGMG